MMSLPYLPLGLGYGRPVGLGYGRPVFSPVEPPPRPSKSKRLLAVAYPKPSSKVSKVVTNSSAYLKPISKISKDVTNSSKSDWPIKRTQEVFQDHSGYAPVHRSGKQGLWDDEGDVSVHRSGKQGRNPLPHELSQPPPQTFRMGQSVKAVSKCANLDENRIQGDLMQVDVRELRYSQRTCGNEFQCGRGVVQLVQDLWDGNVRLTDPFLCLTVFQTTDPKTGRPILRCIDNRRLFALKEYAAICEDHDETVLVNIMLYSQHTIQQVKRFIKNTDATDGFVVRMRRSRKANETKGLDKQHRRGRRGRRGRFNTRRARWELWSKRPHWNSCIIAESTLLQPVVIFIGMKWSQSDPGFAQQFLSPDPWPYPYQKYVSWGISFCL